MPQNHKNTKEHKIMFIDRSIFGDILCFGALVANNGHQYQWSTKTINPHNISAYF